MTTAGSLSCPQCGAAAGVDALACAFCHARLATVACPACFGLVFVGSRHCAHCGAKAERAVPRDGRPRRCAAGCGDLQSVAIGGAELGECPKCSGLWLDPLTFERLCGDREHHSDILVALPGWIGAGRLPTPVAGMPATRTPVAGASAVQPSLTAPVRSSAIRYRQCPDCGNIMNRVNFARVSGVVLDSCKLHGIWFDADELRQVIEFIAGGGLNVAQRRERMLLEEERRLAQMRHAMGQFHYRDPDPFTERPRTADTRGDDLLASFLSLFVP